MQHLPHRSRSARNRGHAFVKRQSRFGEITGHDGVKYAVEALKLGNMVKLELALAIYLMVSLCLARLVKLGRIHPDLEASVLFTEAEWKGAYILAKKEIPKTVPMIRDVVRQIAMLGGFLGRKCDGDPGD